VVAALAVFANSLPGRFIYDDEETIVRNPYVRTLWPLTAAMHAPPQSAVAGRPLVSLSLALNYALGGEDPAGYHAFNVVVHLTAALLLFGIVRRALRGQRVPARLGDRGDAWALGVALIWLVHPLQTEVIDYTIQRTESMMGVCYLLTLYAGIRGMQEPLSAGRWLAISIAACAAGAACKESIATAPLMVWLYDSVFEAGSFRGALTRRGGYYAGLLASWGMLAWLNIDGPRFRSAGLSAGVTPWMYLVNQGPIIATYLARTIWPHPLVADYGRTAAIPFAAAAPSLLLVAGLAVVTLAAWRWDRRLAFLGTWFFVTLAPASSIVPIATEVGAERRMYLPLAALAILMALVIDAVSRRIAPQRAGMAAAAIIAIVCTVLAGVSFVRNADYHDRLRLWQTVLDARPHGRAHYNLAVELAARGRSDEAIDHYRQATADAPEGHYALGFMYAQRGKPAEAAAELRQFLDRLPGDALAPKASNLLGLTLMQQGDAEGAATAFRTSLSMQPRDGDALGGLADALRASGRWAEAESAYRAYLQVNPANAAGVGNLGIVLSALGRDTEAADAFARAVALAPQSASARVNYALSLAGVGRRAEAVAQLRIALQLEPGNAQARGALEELGK